MWKSPRIINGTRILVHHGVSENFDTSREQVRASVFDNCTNSEVKKAARSC
jgi:hypothetical protein